ncbi:hypothetical protein [Actinomadura formosensis]|uniref:hypothetical protein n=1 Tax=Actinomadura formosensis TaxID=60706 RepID=UPI000ADB6D8A|nr:hypothetical protein [Actinomadura formosensis]
MRRSRLRRAAAVATAVLATAGCGVRPTGIISAGDPPDAHGNAAAMTVYLVQGGRLEAVTRPGLPGRPYLAIDQLSVTPTSFERSSGLRTEVHPPARVEEAAAKPTVLIVHPAGPPSGRRQVWSRLAVAQITCTAAAIPGVEAVKLAKVHGPMARLGPLTCDQFSDLLS